MATQEEYSIIEECRNGNPELYSVLVERHQNMVYNIVYRMIGDADAAKDIAQESFIAAYGGLHEFRNGSKFSTWLCSIAMNKCRDALRSVRNTVSIEDAGEAVIETAPNPEAELSRKQSERNFQAALAALPPEYREVIVFKHVEGMDYKEMETILGVSVNTLKVRTHRARELLKKLLCGEKAGLNG